MELLLLGGSVFLGRAVAEAAVARGHSVTTFNRGRSGADVPGVAAVHGDRQRDLDRLRGRCFDAVVDTSGFVPRDVLASARLLESAVSTYAFVSSVSALRAWGERSCVEDDPAYECRADAGPDAGDYGVLKAGCERAVAETFGAGRSLVLRPGLILGPHENIGRLPWWLRRVARGGTVVAPGSPDVAVQLIDARDIATFTLDLLERRASGAVLVTAPAGNTTFGELLAQCVEVTESDAELTWVPDDVLLAAGVQPWTELPLWLPRPEADVTWQTDTSRAEAWGLRCRPVAETVADTWRWLAAGGTPAPCRPGAPAAGLEPDKEGKVLAAYRATLT